MTVSHSCPLCAAALSESKPVQVCLNCYAGIEASNSETLSTTGEFTAMTDPTVSVTPLPSIAREANTTEAHCCWCNKTATSVKKLLSQGDYHICNECVALCADILRMELGDDFG